MLGVVLAGGASRRMGREKALVEVAGRPMIGWVTSALETVCDRVEIAGQIGGRRGLADPPGVRGPLAGLRAGLALGQDLLLVAVDQPWVRPETLRELSSLEGTVIPIGEDIRQVTCARYAADLAPAAAAAVSLQELLDKVAFAAVEPSEWRLWGEDGRSWYSVDDDDALDEGLRRFGPPVLA
ncbi:MAG TPA: NTP transferase domain-containing protein [Acidimicrobiia bacterium]|nr:NTP transferase domain-containing protein [Acidimicrobiia bacterium]